MRMTSKMILYLLGGFIPILAMDVGTPEHIQEPSTGTAPSLFRMDGIPAIIADGVLGGSGAHAAEKKRYRYPSDEVLMGYLDQSTEDTLRPTGVVYVSAVNFAEEVLAHEGPVMVLFFSQGGSLSRGSAAFVRVLHQNFPEIKVAAYVLPPARSLSIDSFQVYNKRYGLKGVPTTLFYDHDKDGHMDIQGKVNGGYEILENLKYYMEKLFPMIEKDIMDE